MLAIGSHGHEQGLGFGSLGAKDAGQQWNCQNGCERLWIITTSVFRIESGIEIRHGMRRPVARVENGGSPGTSTPELVNQAVAQEFFASQVEA